VLRLPPYTYHRPASLETAIRLLSEHGTDAMPIAGGTDLVPNMKHGLFAPAHLVSLRSVEALRGFREEEDGLRIGAAETLDTIDRHPVVRDRLPALARACGLVSGPQLRRVGTIGGNVCLDTRCTYYNQTLFWRKALGYCLKKDGDVCHVVPAGTRCVAAHSADTPPVLIVLGASLEIIGSGGTRRLPIANLFTSDGIWNRRMERDEILVSVFVPWPPAGAKVSFQKLRSRGAIDFPLVNLAVLVELDGGGRVTRLEAVASAMGSYPRRIGKIQEAAEGNRLTDSVIDAVAYEAFRQSRPLDNIPIDAEWRRAMIPVLVRRALEEIAS